MIQHALNKSKNSGIVWDQESVSEDFIDSRYPGALLDQLCQDKCVCVRVCVCVYKYMCVCMYVCMYE